MTYPANTAAAAGLALCHSCHHLDRAELHECSRCGSALHLRNTDSLQRALALLFTAVILYIPANVLPIMTTLQLGKGEPSTILGGVVLLIKLGSYPIAAVIFVASVMVPLAKLMESNSEAACIDWIDCCSAFATFPVPFHDIAHEAPRNGCGTYAPRATTPQTKELTHPTGGGVLSKEMNT